MTDSEGFMGFWADIDRDYVLRYQEWHNCEHMPERVGIVGFCEGRRYRGEPPGPMFFMCYVTDGPEVLRSEAYLAALNRPTAWTREALTHFRNPTRSIFKRVREFRFVDVNAPYRLLIRFDDPREALVIADALQRCVGATTARDDAARATLYEIDLEASNIMTAERAIYAGGAGAQRYLLSVETGLRATAEVLESEVRCHVLGERSADVDAGVFWLEMKVPAVDIPGKSS